MGRVNNPSPYFMTNFLKQLNILSWHILAIISIVYMILDWVGVTHPPELQSALNLIILLIASAVIDIRKDINAK